MLALLKEILARKRVAALFSILSGSVFSQLIVVGTLPILTRIYSPSEFSSLAVFTAIVSVVSVVGCLRLDIAIPLPGDDGEANTLLKLSLLFSFASGVICLIAVAPFVLLGHAAAYFLLLSVAVWLLSSFSALQFWLTRNQLFKEIGLARMVQAVASSGSQMVFGYMGATLGLVLGYVFGSFFGVYRPLRRARVGGALHQRMTMEDIRGVLSKYKKFPLVSTFESLANTLGVQASIILVSVLTGGPEAGFIMLAMKFMGVPMTLLGGALSQVYLASAPEEMRKGNLALYTAKTLYHVLCFGVGPLLCVALLTPTLFPLLLGEQWARAGVIAAWMAPWFAFQLLASPISMVMHLKNLQLKLLCVTVLGCLLRIVGPLLGMLFSYDITTSYILFSAVFYFTCLLVFSQESGVHTAVLVKVVLKASPWVLLWLLLAKCVLVVWGWI